MQHGPRRSGAPGPPLHVQPRRREVRDTECVRRIERVEHERQQLPSSAHAPTTGGPRSMKKSGIRDRVRSERDSETQKPVRAMGRQKAVACSRRRCRSPHRIRGRQSVSASYAPPGLWWQRVNIARLGSRGRRTGLALAWKCQHFALTLRQTLEMVRAVHFG